MSSENVSTPSGEKSSASRCLNFGETDDRRSNLNDASQHMAAEVAKCESQWNFSFDTNEPLPGQWQYRHPNETFDGTNASTDHNSDDSTLQEDSATELLQPLSVLTSPTPSSPDVTSQIPNTSDATSQVITSPGLTSPGQLSADRTSPAPLAHQPPNEPAGLTPAQTTSQVLYRRMSGDYNSVDLVNRHLSSRTSSDPDLRRGCSISSMFPDN